MRQPTFQQWQHMYQQQQADQPLTVVVVEYQTNGCSIERERVILAPASDRELNVASPAASGRARR